MTDEERIKNFIQVIYPAAASSGNADTYAALYADDALWSAPNLPDRRGPAGIRFAYIARNTDIRVATKVEDYAAAGDLGFATGLVHVIEAPRNGAPRMTYLFRAQWVFRKIRNAWKIQYQVWNDKPTDLIAEHFPEAV